MQSAVASTSRPLCQTRRAAVAATRAVATASAAPRPAALLRRGAAIYVTSPTAPARRRTASLIRAEGAAPTFANLGAPRGPPSFAQRLLASAWYIVPAMDASAIELAILKFVPALNWVMSFNFPWFCTLIELYYSSQFTPLIIFFAMYLAVVRNNSLHHFIRFHCMQAVTLDICVMLLTLVRSYFPPDLMWSSFLYVFDAFFWSAVAVPIVYCVVWAIKGAYPDLKFVSESVYLQVDPST